MVPYPETGKDFPLQADLFHQTHLIYFLIQKMKFQAFSHLISKVVQTTPDLLSWPVVSPAWGRLFRQDLLSRTAMDLLVTLCQHLLLPSTKLVIKPRRLAAIHQAHQMAI